MLGTLRASPWTSVRRLPQQVRRGARRTDLASVGDARRSLREGTRPTWRSVPRAAGLDQAHEQRERAGPGDEPEVEAVHMVIVPPAGEQCRCPGLGRARVPRRVRSVVGAEEGARLFSSFWGRCRPCDADAVLENGAPLHRMIGENEAVVLLPHEEVDGGRAGQPRGEQARWGPGPRARPPATVSRPCSGRCRARSRGRSRPRTPLRRAGTPRRPRSCCRPRR